jgi:A/G-specific adenine glycosylase
MVSETILQWYLENKRDLPWRNTKDAYKIWISEVILQQTRVIQGLPYYHAFIEKFPTIQLLAEADEQDVLRLWQGLGYYSRARNMHQAAKFVVENLNGIFPTSYQNLLKLKGIGTYTAAAIASFSSNEHVAVLDGNVMRVLTRIFNLNWDISVEKNKKELQKVAESLLPIQNSAQHNQAMMEFGALQCLPQPNCITCPAQNFCLAFKEKKQLLLPIKTNKIKLKKRYFNYLVFSKKNRHFYLKQRLKGDIWQGLYDFYMVESQDSICDLNQLFACFTAELKSSQMIFLNSSNEIKHILTHQHIFVKFWHFEIESLDDIFLNSNNLLLLNSNQIQDIPKPILIKNWFDNLFDSSPLFN